MIRLSTGKIIDVMMPITLLGLTQDEYEELIAICREAAKRRAS